MAARKPSKKIRPAERLAFAQRLRAARETKHTYANQMADAIGIEHETYRNYERADREPDIATYRKICAELEVSLDYLVLHALPRPNASPSAEIESRPPFVRRS